VGGTCGLYGNLSRDDWMEGAGINQWFDPLMDSKSGQPLRRWCGGQGLVGGAL
jgi:hypothetical protein